MLKKKLSVKERIEPFYLGGSVAYSGDGSRVYCQFKNHIKVLSVEAGKQIGQCGDYCHLMFSENLLNLHFLLNYTVRELSFVYPL